MKKRIQKKLTKGLGLAAIAGLRSMSAPALLSNYMEKHPSHRLRKTHFNFMQSGKTANLLKVLAAAEMLGDKLPGAPNRTKTSALLGRGLSGALVGATLGRTQRKKYIGGALGMLSAIAATYASFYLRKKLSKKTGIPDAVWGALEDFLVVRSGQKLLHRY